MLGAFERRCALETYLEKAVFTVDSKAVQGKGKKSGPKPQVAGEHAFERPAAPTWPFVGTGAVLLPREVRPYHACLPQIARLRQVYSASALTFLSPCSCAAQEAGCLLHR